MAILSVLSKGINKLTFQNVNKLSSLLKTGNNSKLSFLNKFGVRNGSDGPPKFEIHASKRQWNKHNDMLHFYAFAGIGPILMFIFYMNVTVGPAKLAPIPEGYEPKHYEYHKNAIKRMFSKYIYPSFQEEYERYIFHCWQVGDRRAMSEIRRKYELLREGRQAEINAPGGNYNDFNIDSWVALYKFDDYAQKHLKSFKGADDYHDKSE